MKNIILATHSFDELFPSIFTSEDQNWAKIEQDDKKLIVIFTSIDIENDCLDTIKKLDGETIVLYHEEYEKLGIDHSKASFFDCGSPNRATYNAEHREQYDKLREQKMEAFDEAWTHFSKPDPHEAPLRELHEILSGKISMQKLIGEDIPYNNNNDRHINALIAYRDEVLK